MASPAAKRSSDFDEFEDWWLLTDQDVPNAEATIEGGVSHEVPLAVAADDSTQALVPKNPIQAHAVQQVQAPLNATVATKKRCRANISPSVRESHVIIERQRRRGMNQHLTRLSSLLPESASKSDKLTIVSETIDYIQTLQKNLEDLSKKRAELEVLELQGSPASVSETIKSNNGDVLTSSSSESQRFSNAVVTVRGLDVFVTLCYPRSMKHRSVFPKALTIVQKNQLLLVNASISTDSRMVFQYIHAKAKAEIERGHCLSEVLSTALERLTTDRN